MSKLLNAWIEPSGKIHEVGLMGHSLFAGDWLIKHKRYADYKNSNLEFATDYLTSLRWMRILTWGNRKTEVLPLYKKWTKKQENSLHELCLEYNLKYLEIIGENNG